MFTGIVEEKGKIVKIIKGKVQRIDISSHLELKKGDNIAIQGICLTVTAANKNGFSVEATAQTKEITTLSQWQPGDYVNLERALRLGDRLAGHILLGHIDETAKLIRIADNNYYFKINPVNSKYLIPRGPIGIDGVSLTIGNIAKNIFSVSLIPYTLQNTNLGGLKIGSFVNIEYDYLIKIFRIT